MQLLFFKKYILLKEVKRFGKLSGGGEVRYSHGESDRRGISIAFREGLNFQIENEIKDKNGRILILKVTIQGSNFILINIYNANIEQEKLTALNQLDEFLDTIEINRDTRILLGGDLNFIHDLLLDADRGKPSLKLMSIATMQDLQRGTIFVMYGESEIQPTDDSPSDKKILSYRDVWIIFPMSFKKALLM